MTWICLACVRSGRACLMCVRSGRACLMCVRISRRSTQTCLSAVSWLAAFSPLVSAQCPWSAIVSVDSSPSTLSIPLSVCHYFPVTVCVCVCVRACVRACVCVRIQAEKSAQFQLSYVSVRSPRIITGIDPAMCVCARGKS